MQQNSKLSTAIGHALTLSCPKCGEGKLFQRYLKQVDLCAECGTNWEIIRADDGPAWITIMIVGHIAASLALYMALATTLPVWQIVTILSAASLILSLATLPFAKAVFIAVIWKTGAGR